MYKVAILIDWDNIKQRVFHNSELLKNDTPKFLYNSYVQKLPLFFLKFLEEDERPYRIYFYLAEPYKGAEKTPDGKSINFVNSKEYNKISKFIKELSILDLVAIRKGRLAFRGWREKISDDVLEYEPIFVQKKVDMLLGLDIAHLTFNKLVDRILIFSYDTDLQPALKLARIGGIQIILPLFKEMNPKSVPQELKIHSDFLRIRSYEEICSELLKKE